MICFSSKAFYSSSGLWFFFIVTLWILSSLEIYFTFSMINSDKYVFKTDFYSFTQLLQDLQSFDFRVHIYINCLPITSFWLNFFCCASDSISTIFSPKPSAITFTWLLAPYCTKTKHDTWLPSIHLLCCRLLSVEQK